jgi:transposase
MPQAQTRAAQRRARRLTICERVWTLHRQGWSNRAIAQQLGSGRMTVVRYLQAPTFPERKGRSDTGRSVLSQPQPLTTRRATRFVLKRPEHRTKADLQLLAHLASQHRDLAGAVELAQDFGAIVRQRQADRFDDWLARAVASGLAPLRRFARGLRADDEAVNAGLRLPWSHGPVEGHMNRLKMLKRSMFGRAKLDLLRRRFLRAASAGCLRLIAWRRGCRTPAVTTSSRRSRRFGARGHSSPHRSGGSECRPTPARR